MIVVETVEIDGVNYLYTYSNTGHYVVRDGISYTEAYDPIDSERTYIEGDVMPEYEGDVTIADKAEAYDIMMGTEAN